MNSFEYFQNWLVQIHEYLICVLCKEIKNLEHYRIFKNFILSFFNIYFQRIPGLIKNPRRQGYSRLLTTTSIQESI